MPKPMPRIITPQHGYLWIHEYHGCKTLDFKSNQSLIAKITGLKALGFHLDDKQAPFIQLNIDDLQMLIQSPSTEIFSIKTITPSPSMEIQQLIMTVKGQYVLMSKIRTFQRHNLIIHKNIFCKDPPHIHLNMKILGKYQIKFI